MTITRVLGRSGIEVSGLGMGCWAIGGPFWSGAQPLGWLWARSDRTVPIPGCRTVAQVEENAGALAHGPLTAEQVTEIDHLLDR